MSRSASCLRNFWEIVARETMQYIAAKSKVQSLHICDINQEMVSSLAQEQYRRKSGRKSEEGVAIYAPQFRWLSTAE